MSRLATSHEATMAVIERAAAREAGELRRCATCGAENIVDDPDCPRGAVGCNVFTVRPTVGISRD